MWFGIKPNRKPGKFTDLDVLLCDALRMHRDSLCPDCGQASKWVYDPRLERYFVLDDSVTCSACGLRDLLRRDNDQPEPGQKLRFINLLTDDAMGVLGDGTQPSGSDQPGHRGDPVGRGEGVAGDRGDRPVGYWRGEQGITGEPGDVGFPVEVGGGG